MKRLGVTRRSAILGEFAFDKRLPYEEQLRAKAVMLQLAATAAALKEPVTTTARDVLAQALWDEATRFEASQNVLGLPSPLRDALRYHVRTMYTWSRAHESYTDYQAARRFRQRH